MWHFLRWFDQIVKDAPHDLLLPRVAGAVHHGGAGTTAASLRAGKPMAICPFFGDQPFWARRIHRLGVGAKPMDRDALSAEAIADALRQMKSATMRHNAATLGAAIRQEGGVSNAIEFISKAASSAA